MKKLYLLGFYLILALPLLSAPPLFMPPAFSKALVFRVLLSFFLLCFIYDLLFKREKKPFDRLIQFKPRMLIYLFLALFGLYFISTIFSVDRSFSFWGDPFRGGGFLNLSFYFILSFFSFLVLEKEDWPQIWKFSLFIALLVSLGGIFQKFGIFSPYLKFLPKRPFSSLGNPIHLASYLLFSFFIALLFFLKEKSIFKKVIYAGLLFIFLFTIAITETRAAYLGLFVSFFYFVLFYPQKKWLVKGIFFFLLLGLVFGFWFLKTQPNFFFPENKLMQEIVDTIKRISWKGLEARRSAWSVYLKGVKERPILGWGLENQEIPFNKYYDPRLPGFGGQFGGDWWDRAHNTLLDIALNAGLPTLFVYLGFLGVLFFELQKAKKDTEDLFPHTFQTILLGHFVINLTSFDTFSTYLLLFFLFGHSFFILRKKEEKSKVFNLPSLETPQKQIVFIFFVVLVFLFSYFFNIKPLLINKEVNIGEYFVTQGNCLKGLSLLEKAISRGSFLAHYSRLKFSHSVQQCINRHQMGDQKEIEYAHKVINYLEQNTKERPLFIKNWFIMATHANFLLAKTKKLGLDKELVKKADFSLKKAQDLAPKRTDLLSEHARFYNLTGQYQKALEKTEKCLFLYENHGFCWWQKGLAEIYLGEIEKGEKSIARAQENGYPVNSKSSILDLVRAYGTLAKQTEKKECYQALEWCYKELIKKEPNFPQWHASLAYVYFKLGDFEKAKKEALILLELSPQSKKEVEEFLKLLE